MYICVPPVVYRIFKWIWEKKAITAINGIYRLYVCEFVNDRET